jgi:tetratricopeptide (TPR) repeat protein
MSVSWFSPRLPARAALLGLLAVAALPYAAPAAGAEPVYENPKQQDSALELARLRNEGVAQYESGIGLKKALAAFEAALQLQPNSAIELFNLATTQRKLGDATKALDLLARALKADPKLAQAYYTRGLIQRTHGDTASALTAFEAARARMPQEASVHYQLGRLYRELQQDPKALQEFVDALQLDPQHTGAMYQLFLYYQQHGENDRSKAMFDEFSRVKRALSRTRRELNDDESWLTRPIVTASAGQQPAQSGPQLKLSAIPLGSIDGATAVVLRDIDGDGLDELLVGGHNGMVTLYHNDGKLQFTKTATFTLGGSQPVVALNAAILVRGELQRVIVSSAAGLFVAKQDLRQPGGELLRLSATPATQIYRADLDHDGDVDLFTDSFKEVWLNDGAAGLTRSDYLDPRGRDVVARLAGPIVALDALDRNGIDFVVHGADGARVLIADALGGRHEQRPFQPLTGLQSISVATAADLDNDGGLDLIAQGRGEIRLAYHRSGYEFSPTQSLADPSADQRSFAVGDFDNDGWKDLLEVANQSAVWRRNAGNRKFQEQSVAVKLGAAPRAAPITTDLDRDGRLDAVVVLASGQVVALKNDTQDVGHLMRVSLAGLRSAPSGLDTTVEVRRGNLYEKYVSSGNAVDLPLGKDDYAEILRIKLPNGFVESKLRVDAGRLWSFKESERVSGSCPSVFAWDGGQFRFITDAFISGPMGVPYGRGSYFPVDHDEYVKIPGDALRSSDARLRIAITEELREAVFLDRARLLAVDHPLDTEAFPNEFLHAGEFPEFKVHLTRDARPPATARDQRGRDVRELISAADRRYPTGFQRLQYEGLAEENGVEFSLPPGAAQAPSLRLFLTGWFHYFESTSLVAVAQRTDLRPQWPQIEVLDRGSWRKVVEIGIPSGKDKTVVVDLTHRLPPDAQQLRIRTNLALYWDRIAIDASPAPHEISLAAVSLASARLRFKGFSSFEPVEAAARPQPERFVYAATHYNAPWNPLEGSYTRYGLVDALLGQVDSQMAVFGSGDEVLLEFDSSALPELRRGWRRDYLLHLDGFVKDGDKYTAHAGRLDPIPYAGLKSYPYDPEDGARAVFSSPAYRDYVTRYQTRAPLRFTGPTLAPPALPEASRRLSSAATPRDHNHDVHP